MTGRAIPVTLPHRVWWRLGQIAEDRGVTVGALIGDAVEMILIRADARPVPGRRHEAAARYDEVTDGLLDALRRGDDRMLRALLRLAMKQTHQPDAAPSAGKETAA